MDSSPAKTVVLTVSQGLYVLVAITGEADARKQITHVVLESDRPGSEKRCYNSNSSISDLPEEILSQLKEFEKELGTKTCREDDDIASKFQELEEMIEIMDEYGDKFLLKQSNAEGENCSGSYTGSYAVFKWE